MQAPVTPVRIETVEDQHRLAKDDLLVTEEPLEIRLWHGPTDDRSEVRLSVTMRTPGQDEDLVRGFLFTEAIIADPSELVRIVSCTNVKKEERGNVMRAELHPSIALDPAKWQRNFYTTSSCGVCGKSSLEAVRIQRRHRIVPFGEVDPRIIGTLPERMRKAQTVFHRTGGIHAAALFDRNGELLLIREDVGRHNAVDKVIGAALAAQWVMEDRLLLVSGRAGFELLQKCVMAGIPLLAAVGAPSSISVDLARENDLTLVGFLRKDRFNIYSPSRMTP